MGFLTELRSRLIASRSASVQVCHGIFEVGDLAGQTFSRPCRADPCQQLRIRAVGGEILGDLSFA